jgi:hypothetical protein
MITATVTIDTDVLEHTNAVLSSSAAIMRTLTKRRVSKVRALIKNDLKAPDAVPDLPFIWSYDPAANARARRWYFANKVPKGSRGGRYQRTGALEAAWEVVFVEDDSGAAIVLQNDEDAARYVWGNRQVPSHYLTGWQPIEDIANRERDALNLGLIEDWYTASDPTAGIR